MYFGFELEIFPKALFGGDWSSYSKNAYAYQVVRAFDSMVVSDITNGMRVGESEIYNSAQQSAEIRWFKRMAFDNQNVSSDYFS